jgi:hypothetical protein
MSLTSFENFQINMYTYTCMNKQINYFKHIKDQMRKHMLQTFSQTDKNVFDCFDNT